MYKNLKERLQFVFVLSLFFPTTLEALFSHSTDASLTKNIAIWGFVIASLVIIYLYVEIRAEKMPMWLMSSVNNLLLFYIALFIPVLGIIAAVHTGSISSSFLLPFGMSIASLLLLPPLVAFLLMCIAALSIGDWLGEKTPIRF